MPKVTCNGKSAELEARPIKFPTHCPDCGTKLQKVIIEAGEGANWKCPNSKECASQICGRLEHWCSKPALNIESVGPETIKLLFKAGIVETIPQLYGMKIDQLVAVQGIGETSANNILSQVEASRSAGMECVLMGLGVPRIGNTLSRKIARCFPDLESFFIAGISELEKAGLGEADRVALSKWKSNEANESMVNNLANNGLDMKSKTYSKEAASGHLTGKTFVFTGTISLDRDTATRMVEKAGGKVTGSVSKKTHFVVVGDEPGSKKTKAEALGIPILDEEQFRKLLEGE